MSAEGSRPANGLIRRLVEAGFREPDLREDLADGTLSEQDLEGLLQFVKERG